MTTVLKQDGTKGDSVNLDPKLFDVEPNTATLHQVVTAQLAAARSGTHNTKTRAEARGGGAKPFRQKGTGRARQGSVRAPHFSGGGVAHGPKPRDYSERTPKKMIRIALASALSDRARDNKVVVVESWNFSPPKTKDALSALEKLGIDGKVLVVLRDTDQDAFKAFRNIPTVEICSDDELNAYDILCNDWVVFTKETLPTSQIKKQSKAKAAPVTKSETKTEQKVAPKVEKPKKPQPKPVAEEPEKVEEEASQEPEAKRPSREERMTATTTLRDLSHEEDEDEKSS